MKTTDWNKVLASAPVDRLAALSSAVGFSSDEETLLERAKEQVQAIITKDPCFNNLIGLQKGRLVVAAYAGSGHGGRARWIVRCVCGRYEVRTTRALRPENKNDRCSECDKLNRIQLGLTYFTPK